MTHKASRFLDSPSIIRMYLKDRITFDQAWGIEEYIRWRNQNVADYKPHVKNENRLLNYFLHTRRQLFGREGREAEVILSDFVLNPEAVGWTLYDVKHDKQSGWMKSMIYFMGEKLKHLPTYFGEEA